MRTLGRVSVVLNLLLWTAAAAAGLGNGIDEAINLIDNDRVRIGIAVVDPGDTINQYEYNGDALFIPASNMKLLTTGAALDLLGPDHTFQTRLYLDGDTLTLLGDGDPALADPYLLREMGITVEDLLTVWVRAVEKAGVSHLDELRVDPSIFDDHFVHPSWPIDELNLPYSAEVAGLNFHANVLSVYTEPTSLGQPPRLTLEPEAPFLEIPPGGRTDNGSTNSIWFSRKYMTNEIRVHGKVAKPPQRPEQVTLHDIPSFVGALLADRLARAGIEVDQVTVGEMDDPLDPGELLTIIRTPIASALQRCNRDSNNLYAESFFKRLGFELTGASGTWATGSAALRHSLLDRVGPASAKTVIADGSGLSRENRLSPRLMVEWLLSFLDDDALLPTYIESMAVAGESGTLRKRFRSVNLHGTVHAKSGYLHGVSCLSGYVVGVDGQTAAFSIMVNDIGGELSVSDVKLFQEAVVAALDEALQKRAVQEVAGSDEGAAPATASGG